MATSESSRSELLNDSNEEINDIIIMPTTVSVNRTAFIKNLIMQKFTKFSQYLWASCSACCLIFYLLYVLFSNFIFGIFVFVSVIAFLYCYQDNLLYHPDTPPESRMFVEDPSKFGLPHEDLFLTSRDGVKLHAYFIKQPLPQSYNAFTFVFFHGNAGNIGHRLQNVQQLYRSCGVNVFLIEYRGYGRSQGKPSEEGFLLDAKAATDYIHTRSDLNQSKLVLFGRSLGGAVAIAEAATFPRDADAPVIRGRLAAVIVENTFTSILDMSTSLFKLPIFDYWPNFLIKNKYPSVDIVSNISAPVLFISGQQDELVPPDMMRKLFQRSIKSAYKRLILVQSGTHNESWRCSGYYEQILLFLREVDQMRTGSVPQGRQVVTLP